MTEVESRLLEQAREGSTEAFAEFVRLLERRVRAVLARLLDDERDVEEAAQDTFVQAWRNLERFRGDAQPFTWLYRIAVNEALQRTRRRRVETRPLEEVPEPAVADADHEARDELAFLAARLRALPLEARAPLVLRDVEGWSYEQVAEALDLSVPAVKSRVHRARFQLARERDAWHGHGG